MTAATTERPLKDPNPLQMNPPVPVFHLVRKWRSRSTTGFGASGPNRAFTHKVP